MTKATKSTVERLQGEAGDRTKLGYVIWWSFERNLLVDGTKAKAIWLKNGFKEPDFPQSLDAEAAFTNAHTKAHNYKLFEGWLIRRIFHGNEKIVYGVVAEKVDKVNENLDYKKEDKVTLDRSSEKVKLENDTDQGKFIKKQFEAFKDQVDNRRMIHYMVLRVRDMNCLHLRESGGIYFLPIKYEDDLFRLEKAIAEVSPASVLYMLPIYKDDRAKKSLTMAFDETFQAELDAKVADLQKLSEAEGTRDSTFKNRLEELKGFQLKVKVYEDLLAFKATDIRKKISELEGKTIAIAADGRLKRKVDME